MIHRFVTGAVALSLMAGSASAQSREISPANMRDVECLAIMAVLGGSIEEGSTEQMGAVGGMMYYLGRLEGRTPGTDWLAYFTTYLQSPDIEKNLEPHYERCGQEMIDKGASLIQFGDMIDAKAAAAD